MAREVNDCISGSAILIAEVSFIVADFVELSLIHNKYSSKPRRSD